MTKLPDDKAGNWNPLDSKYNTTTRKWEQVRDWWKEIIRQ
jgi:hypothetical protein